MSRAAPPLALILTALLAGCEAFPPWASPTPAPTPVPEYRPEVIGVIDSMEFLGQRQVRVTLSDEQWIDVNQNSVRRPGGGNLTPGDLVFYGTHPEPWFYTLRPGNSPDCYGVNGLATEATGQLRFDFGLVLPKAPDFDRGSGNFRRPGGSFFCVNEHGELTRLYE